MPKEILLPKTQEISVPLDKLRLDVTNVRFTHLNKNFTEKEVESAIWAESDTKQLYEQIKSAKGPYEKPIINADNIVIEGNRRVVCLRRLKKEANDSKLVQIGIQKGKFDNIKCDLLLPETTAEQIGLLLATIHVKGKKKWPTFNRAEQIYKLHTQFENSFDFLAKYLGMGKITLIRMISVYEQTIKYEERHPRDNDWHRKYTYFDELFKRKELKEYRSFQENINKFGDWVSESKFKDVRDVRALARILEDEDAHRALERDSFEEALKIIQSKNPDLRSKEFKKINEVIGILRLFPRKELIKTSSDPARRKMLETLKKEAQNLLRDLVALDK